jgi:PAS domain S-box-containing protein
MSVATQRSLRDELFLRVAGYLWAALSALAGIAMQLWIDPTSTLVLPLLVSLLAVVVTAYFAGRGPALAATAVNLAAIWFFGSLPRFSFAVSDRADLWRLAAFAGAAVGFSLLSHRLSGTRLFWRVGLLLASSLVLMIVSVLAWSDFQRTRDAEHWTEHTYQVLNVSQQLLLAIQDADGRQRGYLLTGNEDFTGPYRAALAAASTAQQALRDLTRDNPLQQGQLKELDELIATRMRLLDRGIDARRERGLEAAIAVVGLGQGTQTMGAIRHTLTSMEDDEHRLLLQRTKTAGEWATRTREALAGGTALLLALLIFAGVTIENDVRKMHASASMLRRQADLLERAPGPVIAWELGGVIEYWNHGAEELYGFSREQAVGRIYNELLQPMHPLGTSGIEARLERDGEWRGELAHVIGGREIIVESRLTLVREPDGRKTILKANRDITEEKRAREEIRTLNQELEQRVRDRTSQLESANKELEAFAYSVSHDLRAPLRGIDGWSMALLEDYGAKLDGNARVYLERVRSETQRMGQLIDDLLKLSRFTRVEMHREQVDLSSLARATANRLLETEPGRRIDFAIEDGLAAEGDPNLLGVVLSNLLANAAKFTGPRATARIEFGQTRRDNQPAFYVRDNGVGFDMAYAGTLFGPFQRLHNYSEFPGTGIGLVTAQRVLFRHGGKIWADARPDQGATFYFTVGAA